MSVEQKKAAFDKANDKSKSRVDSKAEATEDEIFSDEELDGVAGGVYTKNHGIFDNTENGGKSGSYFGPGTLAAF